MATPTDHKNQSFWGVDNVKWSGRFCSYSSRTQLVFVCFIGGKRSLSNVPATEENVLEFSNPWKQFDIL
ncbi:hypothetical protein P879_01818 [Paragonimus westermani]|uniref:Uncharacterized protein n=1 Tax=Paragonimus westermani TaxID=34504 RepID=A0A8T0DQ12_9TREM|nr:hypothetical protein P879_01818 [Paragonimus westermani]